MRLSPNAQHFLSQLGDLIENEAVRQKPKRQEQTVDKFQSLLQDYDNIREDVLPVLTRNPDLAPLLEQLDTDDGDVMDLLSDPALYDVVWSNSYVEDAVKTYVVKPGYIKINLQVDLDTSDFSDLYRELLEIQWEVTIFSDAWDGFLTFDGYRREDNQPLKGTYTFEIRFPFPESDIHIVPNVAAIIEVLRGEVGEAAGTENVVYTFKDGSYVADLSPGELRAEGKALGICVGRKDMGYDQRVRDGTCKIFSIRTKDGKPKFTVEYAESDMDVEGSRVHAYVYYVAQVKGKANRLPGFDAEGNTDNFKPQEVEQVAEFVQTLLGYPDNKTPINPAHVQDLQPGWAALQAWQEKRAKKVAADREAQMARRAARGATPRENPWRAFSLLAPRDWREEHPDESWLDALTLQIWKELPKSLRSWDKAYDDDAKSYLLATIQRLVETLKGAEGLSLRKVEKSAFLTFQRLDPHSLISRGDLRYGSEHLADIISSGADLAPASVGGARPDGPFRMLDGHHRMRAYMLAGALMPAWVGWVAPGEPAKLFFAVVDDDAPRQNPSTVQEKAPRKTVASVRVPSRVAAKVARLANKAFNAPWGGQWGT